MSLDRALDDALDGIWDSDDPAAWRYLSLPPRRPRPVGGDLHPQSHRRLDRPAW